MLFNKLAVLNAVVFQTFINSKMYPAVCCTIILDHIVHPVEKTNCELKN